MIIRERKHINLNKNQSAAFEKRISFYNTPPTENISLEEFESFAIDRLKVLKEIDNLKLRGCKSEEFLNRMSVVLTKYLYIPRSENDPSFYESVRKDVVSHFTLRLAYCKPNDRQWFISQERELLKIRLQTEPDANLEKIIEQNGLNFVTLQESEYKQIRHLLNETSRSDGFSSEADNHKAFYKVPFEDAGELIQKRSVFLKGGFAYVHRRRLLTIILTQYRAHLSQCLARAYKQMPVWSEDRRIFGLTESLPKEYLGRDYVPVQNKDEISLSQLDSLAEQSMPLCMRQLHVYLRKNHHLKHGGRLQYGLFLKGLGISLEKSLEFWRDEFTKGGRNFEKDYEYNIKHSYGTVGKRTSYTPYACQKIINMEVSGDTTHGCPYKHNDKNTLRNLLKQKGLVAGEISVVIGLVEQYHYMEACKSVFDYTHPGVDMNFSLQHPNRYIDSSIKYYKQKSEFEKIQAAKKAQ
eukprot:TRINITY_DN7608_c0_g1_i1.p1 TRINITY_DN7608_c0_g1~~TRINITY_DN7608_c0_g1_i1.p1  ORF type:complete len:466 (-),score=86.95 TRINITY_DN7608_c0_g1_i1:189-1586(-)